MIQYHVTPISGKVDEAARFLRNRHALVSFWRPDQLAIVLEYARSFILDSGAFSAWLAGEKVDFEKYIAWVRKLARHPGFAWAVMPDIIDGTEEENDALLEIWPRELRGVPVWHMHESIDRLLWLGQCYGFVAIGSSGEYKTPNTEKWWKRVEEIMDAITDDDGVPLFDIHGLRQLHPAIISRVPYKSADSSNVGTNTGSKKRFGIYVPPSDHVRSMMIADRIEQYNSPAIWRKNYE